MKTEEIFKKQMEYFKTGETLDIDFRMNQLEKLREAIFNYQDKIDEALKKDLNKTAFESYMTEIGMVLDEIRFIMKHLKKWSKIKIVKTPIAQFHSKSFTINEPYGTVLIMSPWNYPFQLCVEPLVGALAAGNTVVLKPSAYSPSVSSVVSEMLGSIFPEKYVCTVQGGRKENQELLEQPFNYIFFTGSVKVGKLVMEKAAAHLTPVSLELGGKSPAIVDSTADLKTAARRIVFGKFLNAGQTCVAPDYLLAEKSIKDKLLPLIIEAINEFYPDGNYDQMPHIINQRHFERILSLKENEKVVYGGHSDASIRFIEPTVLDDISFSSPVMQQEIFGPILPVITFEDMDSVAKEITSRPKPLALYLFSNDKAVQNRFLRSVSFGGGCINDTIIHLATPHMGFGGVGESGMGSYHGEKSFETFSHKKSIVKKSNWPDLKIRYLPYNDKKLKQIKKFLK